MSMWTRPPSGRGEVFRRLLDDPARLELLAPETLGAQAVAAGLAVHSALSADRSRLHLDHARLLREHGSRTGAPEPLARAARAALAAVAADGRGRLDLHARIEAAAAALASAELSGETGLLDAAADRLASLAEPRDPATAARLVAARAAIAGRRALASGSADAALEAGALLDAATQALARASREAPSLAADLASARMERAALLTGFALRLRDPAPAERAGADMADLLRILDAERRPVLRARAARLLGEALTAEGELAGCPRRLSAASRTLSEALADLPTGHAPVERARLGRALGHAARSLADASADPADARALDAAAVSAFAAAAAELGGATACALHAELAFERALALAGASLRRPFAPAARREAEAALRVELVSRGGRHDPVAWAAVQLALARLYAAEPGAPRRPQAAMACEAALEVFSEAGHRTLAAAAAEALRALAPTA